MTTSERDMIQPLSETTPPAEEKFTSLQPTYEDSIAPDPEEWSEDDYGS